MSSSFHGLTIGLSALQAHQRAMEVAGQNVANVNTPGYSRQRVELSPAYTLRMPTLDGTPKPPQTGSGVDLTAIRRLTDGLLARQLRNESAGLHQWEAYRDGLGRIEGIIQEQSEQGVAATLNELWLAWRELGSAPQETAIRLKVIDSGQRLAQQLNLIYNRLTELQDILDDQVTNITAQVDDKATQVAELNRQIRLLLSLKEQPNELMDRRDQLVREIVETTGATVVENADGTLNVELTGQTLVNGITANALTSNPDGGKLQGLIDVRDTIIPDLLTALDTLAVTLRDEVNAVHTGGFDPDGVAGLAFFQGTGAADLAVNATIANDPRRIAAANTDGGGSGSPWDGDNALDLANLAEQSFAALGSTTIGGYYLQTVINLGLKLQEADEQVDAREAVVQFLENERESISGVSLDEEAVKLIESQRAYQAAARVITSVDEMLDRLINGTGLVGR
jgi:flagellar hook-associated protein 1 FlgK